MSAPALGLAEHVGAYLTHWRALGRRYRQEEWLLTTLVRELPRLGHQDLDEAAFTAWFDLRSDRHPNSRRKWAQLVRHFCLFRRRSEPECFVPGAELVCRRQPYVTPVIVNNEQVARMIEAADALEASPNSPLRAAVMRLAVVLLYTTGMRLGELRRLELQDLEDDGAVLRIRESKYQKSRLLPLSPSTQAELERYIDRRVQVFDCRPGAALLCSRRRRSSGGYTMSGLQQGIQDVLIAAGVGDARGHLPRIHDLRHSFAVQALARWYRQGADVQVELPKLSMYMGHVSIESTAHYLRWTEQIAALASTRFEQQFAGVIGVGS
jgi:integrase/recombinase XerD